MFVALISFEFPPLTATGGIGSYMYHLATLLTLKGNNVAVFSALPGGKKVEIVTLANCINYRVPAEDNERFRENVLPVFETYMVDHKVDVMESPEVGACALRIKQRFPRLKLVVRMHTPGVLITKISNSQQPLLQKIRFVVGSLLRGNFDLGYWATKDKNRNVDVEYQICKSADTLIAPSEALKQWAVNFWDIPAENIKVLPNPFSLQSTLFLLPLTNRPSVISFVGKLSILKGMKALTAAIPLILAKNKNCKIYLVGRDVVEHGQSMKAYMQRELAAYSSSIIFTGPLNEEGLEKIYAMSQVCVFPSLWENYPTVVLEAMAAGAAVVASNVGGVPELINNGLTGLLFNPGKPAQIANAVNELLGNETRRMDMVKTARMDLTNSIKEIDNKNQLLKIYELH